MNIDYDYPLTPRLILALKAEYRNETRRKGNTWREECSIDYLIDKLKEEYSETLGELNALMNKQTFAIEPAKEEIKDQMLILSMIWERLQQ